MPVSHGTEINLWLIAQFRLHLANLRSHSAKIPLRNSVVRTPAGESPENRLWIGGFFCRMHRLCCGSRRAVKAAGGEVALLPMGRFPGVAGHANTFERVLQYH